MFLTSLIIIPISGLPLLNRACAASPSIGFQEISLKPHNWIDMLKGIPTNQGDENIDMRTVSYFSDGKILNATISLAAFNPHALTSTNTSYGMYIDADLNNMTGIQGIDYNVEILWNSTAKSWTKVVEQWTTDGGKRILSAIPNYTGFFQKGERDISLAVDVSSLGLSNPYSVIFYAQEAKSLPGHPSFIADFSNLVYIPRPEFVVSGSPNSIILRPGEETSVGLRINSTSNLKAIVNLSTAQQPQQPGLEVQIFPNELISPPQTTAIVHIRAPDNASPRLYLVPIIANITYAENVKQITFRTKSFQLERTTSLQVSVLPPITLLEQLYRTAPGTLAVLFGLVAAPVIAWIIPGIFNSFNTRRQRRYTREYLETINTLDPTVYQSDKQNYLKSLDNLMRNIEQIYAEGKINDSQFGILKDKISGYHDEAGGPLR